MRYSAQLSLLGLLVIAPLLAACTSFTPTAMSTQTTVAASSSAPRTDVPNRSAIQVTPTPQVPTVRSTPIPQTPTPTIEAGWKRYTKRSNGFTVVLPSSWKEIDPDSINLEASNAALKKQFPGMASTFEGQARELVNSDVKFAAIDQAQSAPQSTFPAFMNIVKVPLTQEMSLDQYLESSRAQVATAPQAMQIIADRRVNLGDSEGLEIQYQTRVPMGTGESIIAVSLQYIALDGKDAYAISLTAPEREVEQYRSVFEKIGTSFQLIN